MRALKTLASALGITVMLVVGVDYAATAATGRPLILGKINKAGAQSTLQRTKPGPALRLVTKSSANPPLATNGRGRVANLNADLVDGLDGASLQNRAITYTLPESFGASQYNWDLPGLPAGTYLVNYSVAVSGSGAVTCGFVQPDRPGEKATGNGVPLLFVSAVNGVGVVTHTGRTQFFCLGPEEIRIVHAAGPVALTFTRIDDLRSASAALR
jgi:hypothetical protein